MNKVYVSSDRIRELFNYSPENGLLTRRIRTAKCTQLGEVAGTYDKKGYQHLNVDNIRYLAHRLIWLHVHGVWPANCIDHIDGNPSNNRLSNLREATKTENNQNTKKARKDNQSGLLGVVVRPKENKFAAKINANGKRIHLGRFDTAKDAHAAYIKAKIQLHKFNTLTIEGALK